MAEMKKTGLLRRFFLYIFERAVKNSSYYRDCVIEKEEIESRLAEREEAISDKSSKIITLEKKVEGAESEVNVLEKYITEKDSEFRRLEERYYSLKQRIPGIINLITGAKKLCEEVRTSKEVIIARAMANKGNNAAFVTWETTIEKKLGERTRTAEEQARILVGSAFVVAMKVSVVNSRWAEKVPFAYYDFVNKNLVYTNATLKMFEVEDDKREKISLMNLLRYIKSDDLRAKDGIISALKTGKRLEYYKVLTSGKEPRHLSLTTYPVFYNKKCVGAGILLYDTKSWLSRPRGTHRFADSIDKIIKEMSDEFSKTPPLPEKKRYCI